jgi:hypothetical protein
MRSRGGAEGYESSDGHVRQRSHPSLSSRENDSGDKAQYHCGYWSYAEATEDPDDAAKCC